VSSDSRFEREWMAQWQRAGEALVLVRATELAALSAAEALAASDTLLAIGANSSPSGDRLTWSGLIELQRHLHSRR
jgi:peptidyl-tRNA hydrolase